MAKMKKEKCDGCCDCTCGKEETNVKPLKVYFCPKCESKEVGYIFRLGNAFGILPKMECKKCGFSGIVFPQLVINMDKLNKKGKKK